jgi:putative ABC transport system ATP-binding protein
MLRTENLSFDYGDGGKMEFPDIFCAAGEHWLLLGQSGSGKTTLLQLLAGLRTPQTGDITIGQTLINTLSPSKLDTFRGRNIGIIFQQPHFVPSLNVEENLALAQYMAGLTPDFERIYHLLDRLNIQHKKKAKTSALSVGEQQRAAIARALVNQPKLILADEPSSALDDMHTDEVIQLLEEQANEVNASLLVVTHDNRLKEHFKHQIHLEPISTEKI